MYFREHFRTITRHRQLVRRYCFRMGLIRQGLVHDLSKYSPTEFREGCRYWQGNRSPNNAEREEKGLSNAWLHHKGYNRHHFEYWIDYGNPGCSTIIRGVPMPSRFVAEMVADRISASRVYLGDSQYTDRSPYEYFIRSRDRLWFVHEQVLDQLEFLLDMLARTGEKTAIAFIRCVFLRKGWAEVKEGPAYRSFAERKSNKDECAAEPKAPREIIRQEEKYT